MVFLDGIFVRISFSFFLSFFRFLMSSFRFLMSFFEFVLSLFIVFDRPRGLGGHGNMLPASASCFTRMPTT